MALSIIPNLLPYAILVTIVILPALISSTKLCPKDNYWYDDYNGKCKPCAVCKKKFLLIKPCSEFSNTMCIDPSAFTFLTKKLETTDTNRHKSNNDSVVTSKLPAASHKWHEMETMDSNGLRKLHNNDNNSQQVTLVAAQQQSNPRNNTEDPLNIYSVFQLCMLAALVITVTLLSIAVSSFVFRNIENFFSKKKGRNGMRNRLFSRDRLSTTEYMNSLATLDRRLAMDEILEKKKNAIFEPQLLVENIYSDEVFVNVPGPRGYRQQQRHHDLHHDYEELRLEEHPDHTHSLLRTTQQ